MELVIWLPVTWTSKISSGAAGKHPWATPKASRLIGDAFGKLTWLTEQTSLSAPASCTSRTALSFICAKPMMLYLSIWLALFMICPLWSLIGNVTMSPMRSPRAPQLALGDARSRCTRTSGTGS